MKPTFYLALLAISAVIISCSKGDTGPPGPIGAQGTAGINGAANVITSTYTITTTHTATDTISPWSSSSTPTFHWVATFVDTNIQISNVDVIEVYWSATLGSDWIALPNPSLINQGDNLSYRYNDDSVSFTYYTGGAPYSKYPGYPATSPAFTTMLFKVIVIPPALALNHPGINWKNATEAAALPEVQAALNRK